MRKIIWLYLFSLVGLFFYSFTQIDLGLALTRFPFLFSIQRGFQTVGYFNRPLSTILYIAVLLLMFLSYAAFLYFATKKKITRSTIWKLIFLTAGILVFSYAAFSYALVFLLIFFVQKRFDVSVKKAWVFQNSARLGAILVDKFSYD